MLYINDVLISNEYQAVFERDIDDISIRINVWKILMLEFFMTDFVELKFLLIKNIL
jgi:hypothetical protein